MPPRSCLFNIHIFTFHCNLTVKPLPAFHHSSTNAWRVGRQSSVLFMLTAGRLCSAQPRSCYSVSSEDAYAIIVSCDSCFIDHCHTVTALLRHKCLTPSGITSFESHGNMFSNLSYSIPWLNQKALKYIYSDVIVSCPL